MESPFNTSEVDMNQYMSMNQSQMGTRYPLDERPTSQEYFSNQQPQLQPQQQPLILEEPADVTPVDSTHVFHPQFDTSSLYDADDQKKKKNKVKSWLEKYWWVVVLVVVLIVGGIGFYWWRKSKRSLSQEYFSAETYEPSPLANSTVPNNVSAELNRTLSEL